MDFLTSRWLGGVILGMTLVSVGIGVKTTVDRNEDTNCLVGYIAENARVTKVRAAATLERDAAVDGLLQSVSKLVLGKPSKNSSAQFRAAFLAYDRKTDDVQKKRAQNPLPDLPESCGDVSK